jgi:hypothetical protein
MRLDMLRRVDVRWRRVPWRWLALALLLVSPISVAGAANAFVPSPALGHGQVVAQGTVVLPGPRIVWRLVERVAQPRGTAVVGKRVLGFVVPSEGPVLLTNVTVSGQDTDVTASEQDEVALVVPGEFYLVRQDTMQIRASISASPVHYLTLELVPADSAKDVGNGKLVAVSHPFDAPAGERDVDLVATNLNAGESGRVADSDQPVLICVTSGTISINPDKGKTTVITLGQFALLEGSGKLAISPDKKATSSADATAGKPVAGYVAAVFGPEIPAPK